MERKCQCELGMMALGIMALGIMELGKLPCNRPIHTTTLTTFIETKSRQKSVRECVKY